MIVDEALVLEREFIETLLLPVAALSDVTCIFATTPGDDTSWIAQAIAKRDPDNPDLPYVPLVTAYKPCKTCEREKRLELCPHVINFRPDYKDEYRIKKLQELTADKDTYLAEMYGIQQYSSQRYFSKDDLAALFAAPRYKLTQPPREIFISIDPANGGHDHYAITGMVRGADGIWVVCVGFLLCVFLFSITKQVVLVVVLQFFHLFLRVARRHFQAPGSVEVQQLLLLILRHLTPDCRGCALPQLEVLRHDEVAKHHIKLARSLGHGLAGNVTVEYLFHQTVCAGEDVAEEAV
jgi:hypothetical protein